MTFDKRQTENTLNNANHVMRNMVVRVLASAMTSLSQ